MPRNFRPSEIPPDLEETFKHLLNNPHSPFPSNPIVLQNILAGVMKRIQGQVSANERGQILETIKRFVALEEYLRMQTGGPLPPAQSKLIGKLAFHQLTSLPTTKSAHLYETLMLQKLVLGDYFQKHLPKSWRNPTDFAMKFEATYEPQILAMVSSIGCACTYRDSLDRAKDWIRREKSRSKAKLLYEVLAALHQNSTPEGIRRTLSRPPKQTRQGFFSSDS